MISVVEVEQLHELLIENFGGSHGIREFSLPFFERFVLIYSHSMNELL